MVADPPDALDHALCVSTEEIVQTEVLGVELVVDRVMVGRGSEAPELGRRRALRGFDNRVVTAVLCSGCDCGEERGTEVRQDSNGRPSRPWKF
jgi:hypothetical protein